MSRMKKCPACKGSGQVAAPVNVGRGARTRRVGRQEGVCITCWGAGEVEHGTTRRNG